MSAVDALLRMVKPGAGEAVVLTAGAPPGIVTAAGSRQLTMPPLGRAMFETFVREVVPAAELERLEGPDAALDCEHASAFGGTYAVRVTREDGGLVLTFRPAVRPGAQPAGARLPAPAPSLRAAEAAASARPAVERAPPLPPPDVAAAAGPPLVAALALRAGGGSEAAGGAAGGAGETGGMSATGGIASLLLQAAERGASDVFFSVGVPPWLRVDGTVREAASAAPVGRSDLLEWIEPHLDDGLRQHLAQTGSVDLALDLRGGAGEPPRRLRVNLFRQAGGLAAAVRILPPRVPSLNELGLPPTFRSLVEFPNGLVLFTGPTGSGKSTTLAALVEHLNATRPCHVITIEDPIEYRFERRRALVHQREVGPHVADFATGLRAALREAPDVILVGEMRDRETVAAALTAAETGHLVLSTLHCGHTAMSIDRILDVFPEGQQEQVRLQLADVLRCVVSQHLLPAADGSGRVPAVEILRMNAAIANLVREGKTHNVPSYLQTGRGEGMVSLDASLAELVRARRIRRETAFGATTSPGHLAELLGGPAPR
jgi:twitching motility protein PilT